MTNLYTELTGRQQAEISAFPIKFAYSDEQFKTAMTELDLTVKDTDKVVSIGNGGFIRKTDLQAYRDLVAKLSKDFADAVAEDKTGEHFIKDMFSYELNNHEYIYTQDVTDTLDALGYTDEDILANPILSKALSSAVASINKWDRENN